MAFDSLSRHEDERALTRHCRCRLCTRVRIGIDTVSCESAEAQCAREGGRVLTSTSCFFRKSLSKACSSPCDLCEHANRHALDRPGAENH